MANAVRVNDVPEISDGSGESLSDTISDGFSPETSDNRRSRWKWISVGMTILLIGVSIAAIAVFVLALSSWQATTAAEARDRQVLDVASTMAVNLVTLGKSTADADLARVVDGTTGDFREQFVSAADGFGTLLADGGVESIGEVKSAGIVASNDEKSTVLAAVTSTVKNNEAPDGEIRVYRMKLTLENVDSQWLVANVEFVA